MNGFLDFIAHRERATEGSWGKARPAQPSLWKWTYFHEPTRSHQGWMPGFTERNLIWRSRAMPGASPGVTGSPFSSLGERSLFKTTPSCLFCLGEWPPGARGWVEGNSLDAVSYAKRFTCILSFDLQNGLLRTTLQVLRPLCKNAWGC